MLTKNMDGSGCEAYCMGWNNLTDVFSVLRPVTGNFSFDRPGVVRRDATEHPTVLQYGRVLQMQELGWRRKVGVNPCTFPVGDALAFWVHVKLTDPNNRWTEYT